MDKLTLAATTELQEDCPKFQGEIDRFVKLHPDMQGKEEAVIYALGQCMAERIDSINMGLEDKGLIVSSILTTLIENNEDALAVWNEIRKEINEQKYRSVH